MEFKTLYDGKRERVSTKFKDDKALGDFDRTKQQFKDECDINKIVARYPNIELKEQVLNNPDLYDSFDTDLDYHTACEIIAKAGEQFDSLPSSIRKRFSYDPAEFLAFVNDDNNRDEAQKLGLLKEKVIIPNDNIDVIYPQNVDKTVISDAVKSETKTAIDV